MSWTAYGVPTMPSGHTKGAGGSGASLSFSV